MTNPEDCENLNCTCDNPLKPGHKLWECGSNLCKYFKDTCIIRDWSGGFHVLERAKEEDHKE